MADLLCPFCASVPANKQGVMWCEGPNNKPHQVVRMLRHEWNTRTPAPITDEQVEALRASNAALIAERASMIETKREQIAQSQARAEAAEARVKALEDALGNLLDECPDGLGCGIHCEAMIEREMEGRYSAALNGARAALEAAQKSGS